MNNIDNIKNIEDLNSFIKESIIRDLADLYKPDNIDLENIITVSSSSTNAYFSKEFIYRVVRNCSIFIDIEKYGEYRIDIFRGKETTTSDNEKIEIKLCLNADFSDIDDTNEYFSKNGFHKLELEQDLISAYSNAVLELIRS